VPVDHESAVPPSRQIANQLRERITSGDLPAGTRLPSITTLMQEHGVARNTARRALAILEDEGLIEIVHGWGSFVKDG
jgi:DNA-binding GntR family transcriptional regulator